MDELKSSGKSFVISKWEVQEAWETVKANKVLRVTDLAHGGVVPVEAGLGVN